MNNFKEIFEQIDNNQQQIFNAGVVSVKPTYEEGYNLGHENGYALGYKAMWDNFTQNNTRADYTQVFACGSWNDDTWKPPYAIRPISSTHRMFMNCKIKEGLYNYPLDLSKCKAVNQMFHLSGITKFPVMDLSSCTNWSMFFFNAYPEWIEGFILPPGRPFGELLGNTQNLTYIRFLNGISGSGFNLGLATKLDKGSLDNIMEQFSTETTGITATLSLAAVNKAYETSEGADNGSTSEEWLNKVAARPNWTINLV